MNTYADKMQENKSQSIGNEILKKQSAGESTFQFVDNRLESAAQRKLQEMTNNSPQAKQAVQLQAMVDNCSSRQQQPIQNKENNTGLPDNLKSGIESLSGYSMDDVKVHYNSDKPSQMQAYAYAQGTDIHLGFGQEKHLPHEAWHVVQQKQGRVKPTTQMKGQVSINDDIGLEKEADVMGGRALSISSHQGVFLQKGYERNHAQHLNTISCQKKIIQRETIINYGSGTVLETMMPEAEGDYVLNLDTGHMMLAETLLAILGSRDVSRLGDLAPIILGLDNVESEEDIFTPPYVWLKHGLFENYPGVDGVNTILGLLPGEERAGFYSKEGGLNSRQGIQYGRGDGSALQGDYNLIHDVDKIYCINGYGYSPLTDRVLFLQMHRALRPGGLLIIVSSAMGPTVRPAHNWSRRQIKNGIGLTVDTLFQSHVDILDYFEFESGMSSVETSTSRAMGIDEKTNELETRHTEGGGNLDEATPTVRIVLRSRIHRG